VTGPRAGRRIVAALNGRIAIAVQQRHGGGTSGGVDAKNLHVITI
jgi:hypothetical protein